MSKCKSCGAEIAWAKTENGKNIPLDVELTTAGNMVLVDGVARVPAIGEDMPYLMFTSHFATCPNADEHRRTR